MRKGAARYFEHSRSSINPQETEVALFSLVNRELAAARTPAQRIRAIGRNHDLWSTMLKDLSQSGNRLPEPLKQQLIDLAIWSMRYSILATLKNLAVQPLLDVNTNILEGLQAQTLKHTSSAPVSADLVRRLAF